MSNNNRETETLKAISEMTVDDENTDHAQLLALVMTMAKTVIKDYSPTNNILKLNKIQQELSIAREQVTLLEKEENDQVEEMMK